MLAVPLRLDQRVIGLLEVFSAQPGSFDENDSAVLERFAETILAAVIRAAQDISPPPPPSPMPFTAPPGSVLFAQGTEERREKKEASGKDEENKVGGIRLSRFCLLYTSRCV